jgi:hypothetical protein
MKNSLKQYNGKLQIHKGLQAVFSATSRRSIFSKELSFGGMHRLGQLEKPFIQQQQ